METVKMDGGYEAVQISLFQWDVKRYGVTICAGFKGLGLAMAYARSLFKREEEWK